MFESPSIPNPEKPNLENKEDLVKLDLKFYVTDHSPDNVDTGSSQKMTELYGDIKQDGVTSVRYDWRWGKIEPQIGQFQDEAIKRYQQAVQIMKGVGLEAPTIVLSNIPAWALDLYKTDKEKFFIEYRQYVQKVRDVLSQATTETGELIPYIQVLNELNNIIYTPIESQDLPRLCGITREVLSDYNPEIKLMGTIFVGNLPEVAKKVSLGKIDLGTPAEEYLDQNKENLEGFDVIAVDYYPGMWHIPIAEAHENKKELFQQLGLLQKVMEKIASWGKEYELGEIGIQTNIPFIGEQNNQDRQRYFFDVFFRSFKQMLLDFKKRNIPLPTRVGLYQAQDQPPASLSGKILRNLTPFPENDMGMRKSYGGRKEILQGKRHRKEGDDRGPSQMGQIINFMNSPVKKSEGNKNTDGLV
jgi:hypothetical protein